MSRFIPIWLKSLILWKNNKDDYDDIGTLFV